jgi:hypothetical protein
MPPALREETRADRLIIPFDKISLAVPAVSAIKKEAKGVKPWMSIPGQGQLLLSHFSW